MRQGRRGLGLAIAMGFVLVFSVFLISLSHSRTAVRRQSKVSHTQKKAYFLAMGAIQHALLKLRLFPREANMAGSLARGVCPWFSSRGDSYVDTSKAGNLLKYQQALEVFRKDLSSDALPFTFPEIRGTNPAWEYRVTSFTVSTYYSVTKGIDSGAAREVVTVHAEGQAFSPQDTVRVQKETVEKQVELTRKNL